MRIFTPSISVIHVKNYVWMICIRKRPLFYWDILLPLLLKHTAGMITIDQVEPAIRNLPEDLQMQALQYIESLCSKRREQERRFSFDWIGELEDEEPTLSTVEIQHKIHTLKV